MANKPLFRGLVVDEYDRPAEVAYVGDEPCYVIDDNGFRRHIPSDDVDRAVLRLMGEMVQGNEDLLAEQAAKMLGQDDIFSRALLINQLKNLDAQFENVLQVGFPDESLAYLGMMGLKIRINIHGEVIEFQQPGVIDPGDDRPEG
jgi:hypothetical protein